MAFAPTEMKLESSAFSAHGKIPAKHSAEGENISPALAWTNPPEGTQSFAVVCHDPDAPLVQNGMYGFVHWVLYNLPASTTELAEGVDTGTVGGNDFGEQGYGGPMPPEGHGVHHYYFWVLAFDKALDLPAGLSLADLLEKTEPHLLGMERLIGTYERN
ncbi:YbhB/YbcL family Raf kinase inhibitor-like protein [Salinisphaera aquimarina]|uniref:YbhB/YbcL family Raf kinase inhibitor-like protein n=1 Tax=Salinisphaera aquimarina TaxID=2094031 RepID=A0ABV7EQI4_9GAMM